MIEEKQTTPQKKLYMLIRANKLTEAPWKEWFRNHTTK